jgi:hypothetical protein
MTIQNNEELNESDDDEAYLEEKQKEEIFQKLR